jgi:hypothetical protein
MPRKEITTTIDHDIALTSQSITTSTTTAGTAIDTAGFNGGVNFNFAIGTRTDGTYTPLIEESDDSGSGFTAVDDIYLVKQDPSSDTAPEAQAALTVSNTTSKVGYVGYKRYVKASIVSSGVTSGTTGAIVLVDKLGDFNPVSA